MLVHKHIVLVAQLNHAEKQELIDLAEAADDIALLNRVSELINEAFELGKKH